MACYLYKSSWAIVSGLGGVYDKRARAVIQDDLTTSPLLALQRSSLRESRWRCPVHGAEVASLSTEQCSLTRSQQVDYLNGVVVLLNDLA